MNTHHYLSIKTKTLLLINIWQFHFQDLLFLHTKYKDVKVQKLKKKTFINYKKQ